MCSRSVRITPTVTASEPQDSLWTRRPPEGHTKERCAVTHLASHSIRDASVASRVRGVDLGEVFCFSLTRRCGVAARG